MTSDKREIPTLRTARLILRSPDERDIPAWYLRATDSEAALLAGDPVPDRRGEGEKCLARSRRQTLAGDRLQWSIDCVGIAGPVGTISLALRVPALSFVFGREYWGNGLATEAAQEVLRYSIDDLALPEISAEVLSRNTASLRVLAKLGFQRTEFFLDDFDGEQCERHVLKAVQFRRGKRGSSYEDT